jgi:predicted XRE-type DNA-binding protein
VSGAVVRGRLVVEPRPGKAPKRAAGSRRAGTAERLARRLALAVWIERKIEAGELEDYAHAARVLGVTRARVSQVAGLALLPAAEQNRILVAGG